MASFQSFLHVGGRKYEIIYSDLSLCQAVDSLGRPASPTYGGTFTVEVNMPGSDDPVLTEWMFSPTKIMDGKVVLKRIDSNATLKVIKFYNAYCVGMDIHFDGTANASFFKVTIGISPEQIDIGGLIHDNHWPDERPVRELADDKAALRPPTSSSLTDSLTGSLSSLAAIVPPLSKSMDEGKVEPPLDPSRGPDYKPDSPLFDPSRTSDYPSADKPTQPTIADSLNRIEKIVDIAKSISKEVFLPESNELTFPDSEGGSLEGRPTDINEKQGDAKNVDSLRRENESAEVLRDNGYHVERLPQSGKSGEKQPDFRINGRIFDCLAPHSSNPRNIASRIEEKVLKGQTKRIVLNLDYENAPSLEAMKEQLRNYPINKLEEVLVVKDGEVVRIFP